MILVRPGVRHAVGGWPWPVERDAEVRKNITRKPVFLAFRLYPLIR